LKNIKTIKIASIAFGGSGVGTIADGELQGLKVFVPYTSVGDTVECEIISIEKNLAIASLIRITEPSFTRVEPPCPYFGICGGCELQHIAYQSQLEFKKQLILSTLERYRYPKNLIDVVKDIVPSEPFDYRMRAAFHISADGTIGFFAKGSRELIQIDQCLIVDPAINNYLANLKNFKLEKFSKLQIYKGEKETYSVLELREEYNLGDLKEIEIPTNSSVTQRGKTLGDEILIELTGYKGLKFNVPLGGFTQVNREINLKLVEAAVSYSHKKHLEVCDLFAGAGNFALPLALKGLNVVAVESDERLVRCGILNAKNNNLKVNYYKSSVEHFLKEKLKHLIQLN